MITFIETFSMVVVFIFSMVIIGTIAVRIFLEFFNYFTLEYQTLTTKLFSKLMIIEKSDGFYVAKRVRLFGIPTNKFFIMNSYSSENIEKAQIKLESIELDENPKTYKSKK